MVVFISMYSVILGMIALAAYVTVGVIIPIAVSKSAEVTVRISAKIR